MALPKVETFEGDITDQIQRKEDVVADLVATTNQIPIKQEGRGLILTLTTLVIILFIVVVGGFIYYLVNSNNTPAPVTTTQETPTEKAPISLIHTVDVLPKSSFAIDSAIASIEKKDGGYILHLLNYEIPAGFTRNDEATFGEDLLSIFSQTSSTTITFHDVTASNQDMRVITSDTAHVAYGFVGTSTLLIATDQDHLLQMRNAILK